MTHVSTAQTSSSPEAAALPARRRVLFNRQRLASLVVWIAFACYVIPLAIAQPQFISFYNIISILMLISVYALIGFGEGVVVLSGGIDLSVGSIVGLAGVVAAVILTGHSGVGWCLVAIGGGVLAGVLIGAFNGIAVALLNIPSFVATLGTLSIALGIGYVFSAGQQISIDNDPFLNISINAYLGIPIPIYIMFIVFLLLWLVLAKTRFGRYIYAVGGNIQAAFVAGLPIRRVLISAFVISGGLSGLAGVLLAAQITAGIASTGSGYELTAIAAPVIGGISLAGGRGSIAGALFGVILLGTIDNGLTILNVSPFYQHIIRGFIIILAVFLDTIASRRKLV
ncbi:Ribose ABC transport system, permease protein RbsC [Salinisphaera sp. LB1]|nr:Ribose ABC transport system, permease protein RbsC [Salinisphaera sp. LB1]